MWMDEEHIYEANVSALFSFITPKCRCNTINCVSSVGGYVS